MGSMSRFRQQLSVSTSGSARTLAFLIKMFLGRRFSPVPERPGFQENTQTAKGTHERRPYTYGSLHNRVNMRKMGRSVSVNNSCFLPLVMP